MQCPNDGAVLVMSERSGIEIDYCPTCRGVWLDRGELDKIIERAGQEFQAPAAPQQAAPQQAAPQPPYPPQGYPQQTSQNPLDLLRQMGGRDRDYPEQRRDDRRYDDRRHDDRGYDQGYPRKKKKDNWLSDLFD
ncbi:TFIIB-type zinc ribbon-containing protein [Agromyces silvae]|uniref:TFIIB-type zinc ribbon-containing protein n=1 Tax=Agromyces silvae TaxID=3388266 RepID=UPI00280B92D2|nr:zf-TFIIB domain-containing protein [Agromyces protaetiae]